MRRTLLITLAIGATAAGCGSAAATTAPMKPERGASVRVMSSRYGKALFDGRSRALYLFTRERGRTSRCYGACAKAWPPFLAHGAPKAIRGASSSLLGT